MRTTWWQKFWRWLVAIQAVILGMGLALVAANDHNLDAALAHPAVDPAAGVAAGLLTIVCGTAALVALFSLLFTAPMLAIVEMAAWWERRRLRRADRRELVRAAAQHVARMGHGR